MLRVNALKGLGSIWHSRFSKKLNYRTKVTFVNQLPASYLTIERCLSSAPIESMGDLNFVKGKRKAGLKVEKLGYSLHEIIKPRNSRDPALESRESTPDNVINGPPHDSSDDESEAQDDALSRKSLTPNEKVFGPIIKPAGSAINGPKSFERSSSPQTGINIDSLNNRATKISSSEESSANQSSLVSSPKRGFDAIDIRASSEEDITSPFNVQYKRNKIDWSKRKPITNIHKSKVSLKSAKNSRTATILATEASNENTGFRNPGTDVLLSQGKLTFIR